MNLEGFHFCPKIHPIFGVQLFWAQFKPREFRNKGSFTFIQNSYYFWNSRNREYSRTAGMSSRGGFKPLGETVCTQVAESIWSRTEKSPRLSNSKNLDYFRIAGILIWKSFTFVQNLPLFLEFQKSGIFYNRGNLNWREFHYSRWNCLFLRSWVDFMESYSQKKFPRLSNSKILDYLKIAGISIWRGFNIFQKNETPDFWTIFKLREGVSSRNFTLFLEFQNSKLFQNRGNVKWREFHSSRWNCLYTRSWVTLQKSN